MNNPGTSLNLVNEPGLYSLIGTASAPLEHHPTGRRGGAGEKGTASAPPAHARPGWGLRGRAGSFGRGGKG